MERARIISLAMRVSFPGKTWRRRTEDKGGGAKQAEEDRLVGRGAFAADFLEGRIFRGGSPLGVGEELGGRSSEQTRSLDLQCPPAASTPPQER